MANVCFILDWDDTMYPTSYLGDFDIEDADWTKHLKVVCLLKLLMGLGNVVIVTAAGKGWLGKSLDQVSIAADSTFRSLLSKSTSRCLLSNNNLKCKFSKSS